MTTTDITRLETQLAAARAAHDATETAVTQARATAELELIRDLYTNACTTARHDRDTAHQQLNAAATQGESLNELFEKFTELMRLDAICGALGSYAHDRIERLDPQHKPHVAERLADLDRTDPQRAAHERQFMPSKDLRPRPTQCAALFSHLTFHDWLAGITRQRHDHAAAAENQRLVALVADAMDTAEAAARKKKN